MLTFDEAAHRYFWNGQPVPNVTTILKPLTDFSMIQPDVLERARQEGVAVHKMVELEVKGELTDLPEWLNPYYDAWMAFQVQTGFEPIATEHQMYHAGLGYAGTTDLIGRFKKFRKPGEIAIVDIKRSLYGGPVIGLQLEAYRQSYNSTQTKDQRAISRFALQLKKDGKYRLPEFTDPNDNSAFVACLAMQRWKIKHNINL